MKDVLREWYPLTEDEKETLLGEGIVVFDTNALLGLYRLSLADRNRVIDLLEALHDRIWLPYQAAEEYQRNRLTVVQEQLKLYEDASRQIRSLRNSMVESVRSHPVLSQAQIKGEISDRLNALEAFLDQKNMELHPPDIRDPLTQDGVLDALTRIFDGRTGGRFELSDDLIKEAEGRIGKRIPPGYEDSKKPAPEKYGDFLLWKEILDKWGDATNPRGLILVTEEKKSDWWRKHEGDQSKLVGPRPELVREAASCGVSPIWFMSLRRFFTVVSQRLGWESTELGDDSIIPEASIDDSPPSDT